ncbi:acyl-CoA/acyl-ACP dehydrogenase [Methylosinus sp. H3A]|uniref:acyl-CoA dehydrogenase family protein n=1 Tax=Methylosinus sp. H3A TaxID=2785786 RepID=UPI0018C2EFCF|nr:acyl-CoA dehydrogenase family protein [Methylosinus sp. H3A]MBG0808275.1 acyl-CoA/acyl-ACP dehydrogenase [Methylosinus sp. H3A]
MKNGVDPQLGSKTEPDWGGLPQIVATFAAKAAGHDRTGAFAFDNYEQLHRLGFLALPIAREFGGLGGSLRDCLRFLGAVAEGDASTALVLSMYFNLHGAQARTRSWPTALYSRIARDSIEQLSLINALNYEPELGSPVRGTGVLGTVAREVSGGWRVSGRKRYATGSVGLRWFTITARTEQNVRGNWFIEADAPGLTIIENWDHLGLRSTASNDLILDDVFVPKDHIVGLMDKDPGERRGPGRSWSVVTWNAIYLGIAKAARNFLVDYVSRRAPGSLGHPLAELPIFEIASGALNC